MKFFSYLALACLCGCLPKNQSSGLKDPSEGLSYFSFSPPKCITDSTLIDEKAYPKIENDRLWIIGYGFGSDDEIADGVALSDAEFKAKELAGKNLSAFPAMRELYVQSFSRKARKSEHGARYWPRYEAHVQAFCYLHELSEKEKLNLEGKLQKATANARK